MALWQQPMPLGIGKRHCKRYVSGHVFSDCIVSVRSRLTACYSILIFGCTRYWLSLVCSHTTVLLRVVINNWSVLACGYYKRWRAIIQYRFRAWTGSGTLLYGTGWRVMRQGLTRTGTLVIRSLHNKNSLTIIKHEEIDENRIFSVSCNNIPC